MGYWDRDYSFLDSFSRSAIPQSPTPRAPPPPAPLPAGRHPRGYASRWLPPAALRLRATAPCALVPAVRLGERTPPAGAVRRHATAANPARRLLRPSVHSPGRPPP